MLLYREAGDSVLDSYYRFATWKIRYEASKAPFPLAWRFGGWRGSHCEIKHVRIFLRLFGYFLKSPVGLGDVAATSQQFNVFSTMATSPRLTAESSRLINRGSRGDVSASDILA